MIRPILLLLSCVAMAPALAAPHLELEVRLDPATREFDATATLSGSKQATPVELSHAFRIERLTVDGRKQTPPIAKRDGTAARFTVPAGGRVTLSYRGRLAPLPEADHRDVLGRLPPMADQDGSYLPGGSGWYPDPGELFTYRLRLSLPAGQKGVAPGELRNESSGDKGYSAEFDFPDPTEAIELMAGPYGVKERTLALPTGGKVRLRTYFHSGLAELADGYLADAGRYIERYSRSIGPYPFKSFSIVSSPLPTGFGMPGLTYLGRDVLKLPFIRATSLGHEILHNWWGNGVYPDWEKGNWSEGLTTFLADYAYKEDRSPAAARQARVALLRNLAAVPESEDSALANFTARHHGISSIVGYDKAAMVFFMLRDLLGQEAFDQGLRLFWQAKRFQRASWTDLEQAFARASGKDLAGFFRQWVEQPGAPRVRLTGARLIGGGLTVTLEQAGDYELRVPVRLLIYPDKTEDHWIELKGRESRARFDVKGLVQAVELDPEYRVWRRVDPAFFPAILREVFVAPKAALIVADDDPQMRAAALSLARRALDAEPVVVEGGNPPADAALLIIGTSATVDAWLARRDLPRRPMSLTGRGTAQVWAGRDPDNRPYAVISARDAAALQLLERGLPHYGGQSWIEFDGTRAAEKGIWPPRAEMLRVNVSGPVATPAAKP